MAIPTRAVALASMLALMVGAVMLLGGAARLGCVADLLSKPTMIGYMNGLAVTILVGQLPKLFGFSVDADGFIAEARAFISGVADGDTVTAALAVGVLGLVVMFVLQRVLPKVPSVLVAVIVSIAGGEPLRPRATRSRPRRDAAARIPALHRARCQGSPTSRFWSAERWGSRLCRLADTIATSSAFAGRSGEEVDGNQEMIGIGAANVAAGFFQGFPVSTSGSRTAVAEQVGAKTQVTGLVGALAIAAMLLLFPGLLRDLPQPTLAAVVIAASLSLADVPGTVRLWNQRRSEFALSIAAFLGVALLGVLPGIAVAVALSVINVFRRSWWPYQTVLGRVEGIPGYHDVSTYPDARATSRARRVPI